MKHSELVCINDYLKQYRKISSIYRVDDSVLRIIFEAGEPLFVDLGRGDSYMFFKEDFKQAKRYTAPFDVLLAKRFANAKIESMEVEEGNRIWRIGVLASSSYKAMRTTLQLEFTGRNTNAIILDENEVVLEAMRHIDSSVSFRSVKVNEVLEKLPPKELKEKPFVLGGSIEEYLKASYEKRLHVKLEEIKKQKIAQVEKKITKLTQAIDALENEEELMVKSDEAQKEATLVLAHLHTNVMKGYQESVTLLDFEGNEVTIHLPQAQSPQMAANMLFKKSKKLRQKALSVHRQKENLEEKRLFLERMVGVINAAHDPEEIHILVPKQRKSKQKGDESNLYETFLLEGYRILLGKNEKGNIALLQEAKKNDIWLHVKDMPSSHVIICTEKQNVPEAVLIFAAKLCVEFSMSQKGGYLVDYTKRKNVKPFDGANVAYEEYQTLKIYKE
ncbi:NFACT RNA binding domain-containing protein [Sulfurospirillum oryzae]|uniref:NFACT RNA binding domain-containing protein n=1 Tax=Sulfurospirillum oryzae TaxID=2976535 RepID=UPI0021E75736|nr:NFACT RNA binding domain-containing protein [Sulfurospirillum oryzae]